MVAWACFFDQIAAPITTELLENPIPCICYAIVMLASFPTDEWSKIAFGNDIFWLGKWSCEKADLPLFRPSTINPAFRNGEASTLSCLSIHLQ